ncbi:MAG: hypothetical protein JWL81_1442 [Verrucomicrobiales bacterium]|nr:hypothetical protein [Verrucomicrobiales bacterium]
MTHTRLSAVMAAPLCLITLPACLMAGTYTNDFSAGATGLTIYTIAGASPEVRTTDGNPGGYLKLTDAVGSTTSTVIFPDLDTGFAIQSFVFEVDCRIGNGTGNPADGFSLNFARTGDNTLDDGVGFNAGAAEEGTPTGLSIGFDTYDNGNGDVVGFSIKLDGGILLEVPATTRNGAVDDVNSLQTGPIGSAGWARFKVDLKTDGTLDVFWKGTKVVDNLATGWVPSGGRMVFAARTGGEWEAHHFDNVSLTTTPAPQASVTQAVASTTGYTFRISDFGATSVVTPATVDSLSIDGATVTATSVTKAGGITTIVYNPPTPLTSRSSHTYQLDFRDQNNLPITVSGSLTTPVFPEANILALAPIAGVWDVREVTDGVIDPGNIGRAVDKLLAPTTFVDGVANYMNFYDPDTNGGGAGLFRFDQPFLTNTAAQDANIIQGAQTLINITGTTPAELQRSFWVQSDDGFALRIKGATFINKAGLGLIDPADPRTILFPDGTGNSDTRGLCQFPAAGQYVVEFVWFQGVGGAYNEVAWANGDFINNTSGTAWSLVGGGTTSPLIPATLPPTPTGATAGTWDVRDIRAAYGRTLEGAISLASGDLSGATVVNGTAPVINFNDNDGARGNAGGGLFNNDIPFLSNTPGDDNDLITVAKATINFPAAGAYTLGVLADDGWAIKVPNAWFTGTSGTGALDPKTSNTVYAPGFNDNPTLAVLNIPTAGNYEVFFIAQEGEGGAGWEIFSAPGAFGTVGGTGAWQLLGNFSAAPAPTPFLPATLPGPAGSAANWGIRFIRGVPAQGDNIYNALNSVINNTGTNTDGTTPYLNHADLDGGQLDLGLFNANSATPAYQVADFEFGGSLGADDGLVGIAKATIEIPAGQGGEWTFGVHSDDGYALRIDGAVFSKVSGASFIDPALRDTAYFRFGTGNSDARAVATLTEGPHEVEFIWFEGGGGAYFELYAAQGSFNNDADTGNWRLVGGPEGLTLSGTSTSSDFAISSAVPGPTPGTVTVTFPSTTGVIYELEFNTSLTAPWSSAGTVTGDVGAQTSVTFDAASLNGGTIPTRFFVRVRRP